LCKILFMFGRRDESLKLQESFENYLKLVSSSLHLLGPLIIPSSEEVEPTDPLVKLQQNSKKETEKYVETEIEKLLPRVHWRLHF
jgi:hypothetical protein